MAQSKENIVTHGLSGLVGKMLVFRKLGDKTIVASRPKVNKNRVPTADQLAIQEKFKLASVYASGAIKDPILKAAYQLTSTGNQSAFNRAFKDSQMAPEFVGDPNISAYSCAIGQKITAKVVDDFRVETVKVTILSATDTLIEEGQATIGTDQATWTYTIKARNPDLLGSKIRFSAYDLPNNETILELVLS